MFKIDEIIRIITATKLDIQTKSSPILRANSKLSMVTLEYWPESFTFHQTRIRLPANYLDFHGISGRDRAVVLGELKSWCDELHLDFPTFHQASALLDLYLSRTSTPLTKCYLGVKNMSTPGHDLALVNLRFYAFASLSITTLCVKHMIVTTSSLRRFINVSKDVAQLFEMSFVETISPDFKIVTTLDFVLLYRLKFKLEFARYISTVIILEISQLNFDLVCIPADYLAAACILVGSGNLSYKLFTDNLNDQKLILAYNLVLNNLIVSASRITNLEDLNPDIVDIINSVKNESKIPIDDLSSFQYSEANRTLKKIDRFMTSRMEVVDHGSYGTVFKGDFGLVVKEYNASKKEGLISFDALQEVSILSAKIEGVAQLSYFRSDPQFKHQLAMVDEGQSFDFYVMKIDHAKEKNYDNVMALSYITQILKGLAALHIAKIIHGDIKPANILINSKGEVKICDFGISHWVDSEYLQCALAYSSSYRPIEMLLGKKILSYSSDMWAFGCLVYYILARDNLLNSYSDLDNTLRILTMIGVPTEAESPGFNELLISWEKAQNHVVSRDLKAKPLFLPSVDEIFNRLLAQTVIHNMRKRASAKALLALIENKNKV